LLQLLPDLVPITIDTRLMFDLAEAERDYPLVDRPRRPRAALPQLDVADRPIRLSVKMRTSAPRRNRFSSYKCPRRRAKSYLSRIANPLEDTSSKLEALLHLAPAPNPLTDGE
jgi:hypothetical protein